MTTQKQQLLKIHHQELEKKLAELEQLRKEGVKDQIISGLKEEIFRRKREIVKIQRSKDF